MHCTSRQRSDALFQISPSLIAASHNRCTYRTYLYCVTTWSIGTLADNKGVTPPPVRYGHSSVRMWGIFSKKKKKRWRGDSSSTIHCLQDCPKKRSTHSSFPHTFAVTQKKEKQRGGGNKRTLLSASTVVNTHTKKSCFKCRLLSTLPFRTFFHLPIIFLGVVLYLMHAGTSVFFQTADVAPDLSLSLFSGFEASLAKKLPLFPRVRGKKSYRVLSI